MLADKIIKLVTKETWEMLIYNSGVILNELTFIAIDINCKYCIIWGMVYKSNGALTIYYAYFIVNASFITLTL